MSDSSSTRNKRVCEQTFEEKGERLEQHQCRYAARSGNETPQERESRPLKLGSRYKPCHLHSITQSSIEIFNIRIFSATFHRRESSVTIPWTVAKLEHTRSQTTPKVTRLAPTMHYII